jgi:hypothetical protein
MIDQRYKTRHHELPLVRVGERVIVFVLEASDWFRRSVQPHLQPNVPVRIDAAEGYAYALYPRDFDRAPVLARRLILRWSSGRLYLDSARGTDGRHVDLNALLTRPTVEELAETALSHPTIDTALSKSGLHPKVQSQLAETARQESALRLALMAQVLAGDTSAMCLCVKLLGSSFGGCDPTGDLYQQATEKLATARYAPHLRDLTAALIAGPLPSPVRSAAVAFCQHLQASDIETSWAAELLSRA